VTTRKLEADIAVASGETIVMGGLVQNRDNKGKSKVPILGDIPLLGLPFRSSRKANQNNEVIVFITPYVLDTPQDIEADARRRYEATDAQGMWKKGWSNSKFAETPPDKSRANPRKDEERSAEPEVKPKVEPAVEAEVQPAPVEAKEMVEKPEDNEEPAAEQSDPVDPMAGLDRQIIRDVKRADRRFGRSLRRADERIESEVEE